SSQTVAPLRITIHYDMGGRERKTGPLSADRPALHRISARPPCRSANVSSRSMMMYACSWLSVGAGIDVHIVVILDAEPFRFHEFGHAHAGGPPDHVGRQKRKIFPRDGRLVDAPVPRAVVDRPFPGRSVRRSVRSGLRFSRRIPVPAAFCPHGGPGAPTCPAA